MYPYQKKMKDEESHKEHLLYSTQEGTYVHSATINVIQTAVQNRR